MIDLICNLQSACNIGLEKPIFIQKLSDPQTQMKNVVTLRDDYCHFSKKSALSCNTAQSLRMEGKKNVLNSTKQTSALTDPDADLALSQ